MNQNIKGKNEIIKIQKIAKTRMAVHTHTHTLYCHLENKFALLYTFLKINRKYKDRTILESSMGLSFCVLTKNI